MKKIQEKEQRNDEFYKTVHEAYRKIYIHIRSVLKLLL